MSPNYNTWKGTEIAMSILAPQPIIENIFGLIIRVRIYHITITFDFFKQYFM